MTVVLPSDVPRWSGLAVEYESGKVDSITSQYELTGPHRAAIWSIARDETIQAWWEEGALIREIDNAVVFVPDPNTYINKFPEWKRVRLVFEPVVKGASGRVGML
ncbi:hypothetical protein FRC00_004015 [Tulasnella sp. 408]|nr:hypothetical protein FRC00_004015 [Tulasnella sp. 408]